MERSDRLISEYDLLADYYDELLGDDESLKLWLERLDHYRTGSKTLELACGTGSFLKLLKENHYDVTGSDISEAMLEKARIKCPDVPLLRLDMTDFKLNEKFDNIVCIVDSFNYLDDKQVDMMLECCYEQLKDNGVLLFDMHHQHRLKEFAQDYDEEGYLNDVPYIFTIHAEDKELYETFTFYLDEKPFSEYHHQYIYDPDDIRARMRKIGFKVTIEHDFIENEKVLMIGKKEER